MVHTPEIVLTNDDGIDAPGVRALADALSTVGDVTLVAPSADNSGVGRALSLGRPSPLAVGGDTDPIDLEVPGFTYEVPFRRTEHGYAVDGTPADCVVAAVTAIEGDPDIVVSGCNAGPNAGTSVFGRSGTVSAVMEAAHFGVPGIAVSSTRYESTRAGFETAGAFTRDLVRFSLAEDVFDHADFLNTLVPATPPEEVLVTEPAETVDVRASLADSGEAFTFTLRNLRHLLGDGTLDAPEGTDREAADRDVASISPLSLPHGAVDCEPLETFAEQYEAGHLRARN